MGSRRVPSRETTIGGWRLKPWVPHLVGYESCELAGPVPDGVDVVTDGVGPLLEGLGGGVGRWRSDIGVMECGEGLPSYGGDAVRAGRCASGVGRDIAP